MHVIYVYTVNFLTHSHSHSITTGNNNKSSQQARKNNTTAITSIVLEKHREYRRKEIAWVKSGIDKTLVYLATTTNSGGGNNNNNSKKRRASIPIGGGSVVTDQLSSSTSAGSSPSSKKKRTTAAEGGGGDSLSSSFDNNSPSIKESLNTYSEPILKHQQSQSQQYPLVRSNSTGGMLNASLRNRYKDVQRERETIEHQNQNKSSENNDNANGNGNDETGKQQQQDGKEAVATTTTEDGNVSSAASSPPVGQPVPTSTQASSSTTPKKKKKTKKTPSKSSSSSTNNSASNFRQQGDEHDNSHSPYSSSSVATLLQPSPRPTERYTNLGGISTLLQQLRELIEYPLSHPELFLHLGVEPPRGVLLRGPPGCGKTHLAKAIAGELNVSYFQVSAPELVGGVSGESELRVRTLFESASNYAPSIIFIDEIDAIAPKRGEGSGGGGGGGKGMEKRIVAQLLTSMDSIHPKNTRNQSAVMVLGATNRPDAMDPALRRAGRFDREIVLGAPDEKARECILRVMTQDMRVDYDTLDFKLLAKKTPGFVGADVRSLTKEAAVIAINRIFCMDLLSGGGAAAVTSTGSQSAVAEDADNATTSDTTPVDNSTDGGTNDIQSITPLTPDQLQPLYVTMSDFLSALPHVQPSAKREGFATVPDVSWGDIGALANIREELTLSVLEPISHPERFEALGLPLPAGVLLYGPPGCGKVCF